MRFLSFLWKSRRSRLASCFIVSMLLLLFATGMRRQEWAYSCELASLVNALDGIGVQIDEVFIRAHVPIDARARGIDPYGRSAWADPHKVIVGNIRYYGLPNGLSYGVFPRPMARAARAAGVHALAVADMSIEELRTYADRVPDRVGIEVWGTVGGARRADGWYADERWIEVTADPHVYHVIRIGDDGIVLGDPYTLQERFFSWPRFDAMWTRQAVLARRDMGWAQPVGDANISVDDLFLELYRSEGGEAAFGLPLQPAYDEHGTRVQYFERAVMELHPEAIGTAGEVQLRRLGVDLHGITTGVAPFPSAQDHRFFGETAHTLAQPFLAYWEQHGARDVFGLPISEVETNAQGFTVQWFERARLEILPDGFIARGMLGREVLANNAMVMPNLQGLGEREARDALAALGVTKIVVDYQGPDQLGELWEQVEPYEVVSHMPTAGVALEADTAVILGIRAPE